MNKVAADRAVVSALVRDVRAQLEDGAHDDAAFRAAKSMGLDVATPREAATLFAAKLPPDDVGPESPPEHEDPFVSRDPLVSLVQTSLTGLLEQRGLVKPPAPDRPHHGLIARLWGRVAEFAGRALLKLRSAQMSAEVAEGVLARLAGATRPFNTEPAEHTVEGPARLIIVGDWGSGLRQAHSLARLMAKEVTDGVAASRAVHVIHLGDVYFAGETDEYERHVLADGWWPVSGALADHGVGSWSLAGNHDMYGGAGPYFDVLLGDRRFRLQRSLDGRPTSWFRLRLPSWDVIGLDSSWNDDPFSGMQTGRLADPQAERLRSWIAADAAERPGEERKRLLLTHHQLTTAYDPRLLRVFEEGRVPELHDKLGPVISTGAITAWMWGHEHRCMAFEHPEIRFARCLGHGGQLLVAHAHGTQPRAPVIWEETASFEQAGRSWGAFGFAVLDVDGPTIDVRYVVDGATAVVPSERFE
jgi:hypothetical protein